MQRSRSVTQLWSLISPQPTQSYDNYATSFILATPEEYFIKKQSLHQCASHSAHSQVPLHIAIWNKHLPDVMEAVMHMSEQTDE